MSFQLLTKCCEELSYPGSLSLYYYYYYYYYYHHHHHQHCYW